MAAYWLVLTAINNKAISALKHKPSHSTMNLHDAETLAVDLMTKHGLIELGWTFRFDNAKRRFGYCLSDLKIISVSRYLTELNVESEVHDMLLHEIAHALAPSYEHHGPTWQRIARSIGASGTRCYTNAVKTPDAPWMTECPSCGTIEKRWRQRGRGNVACGKCCDRYNRGRYDPRFILIWHDNRDSLRFHSDG